MKQSCPIVAVAVVVLALSLAPSTALAQANGAIDFFYVDPFAGQVDLGSCEGDAIFEPPFTAVFRAELWATLRGATAGGISGVEGFIEGVETSGWQGTFTPVDTPIQDGSFVATRVDSSTVPPTIIRRGNFAWSVFGPLPEDGCRDPDANRMLHLGLLQMTQLPATTPVPDDHYLRFVAGDPPANPMFPCPLVTLCNPPVFTKVCVAGGSFVINPTAPTCLVSVEERTWSGVKNLFR